MYISLKKSLNLFLVPKYIFFDTSPKILGVLVLILLIFYFYFKFLGKDTFLILVLPLVFCYKKC